MTAPDWNRKQRHEEEVLELLRHSCCKLSLSGAEWGTAFFLSKDLAATADHNVRPEHKTEFDGYFGKCKVRFRWIEEWSDEEADIAFLRLIDKPAELDIGVLPARHLNPLVPEREATALLRNMPAGVYGFPCGGYGQEEVYIDGRVDPNLTLARRDDKTHGGDSIRFEARRLSILGNPRGLRLPGMSGGPIFSLDWNCVIGVENECSPDGLVVYGTLFSDLLGRLHDRRVPCAELLEHIPDLFGGTAQSAGAVRFLSRRAGQPGLAAASVTVQFSGAHEPGASVAPESGELSALALSAVHRAGEYLGRFPGSLENVADACHRGPDKPYNHALFWLRPGGDYRQPEMVHAAFVLAYLAKVLGETLARDLKMPAGFPDRAWLVGVGFDASGPGIAADPDLPEALRNYPYSGPTLVLHARRQQDEVARVALPAGLGVQMYPVDAPEDVPRALLLDLLAWLESERVREHYRTRFTDALSDLLEQEKALHDAEMAGRGVEAQLAELQQRVLVQSKKKDFLSAKVKAVRQMAPEDLPLASQVEEELDAWSRLWEAEAGLVELVEVQEDRREYVEQCNRLRKRLAIFVHPDKENQRQKGLPPKLPQCLEFTTLGQHAEDYRYLQGMEAAIDPFFGARRDPNLEEQVSWWFDRLFALRELHSALRAVAADLRTQAAAYGDDWKTRVDEGVEEAQEALRVVESQVDALWWELRWRLGAEFPSPQD